MYADTSVVRWLTIACFGILLFFTLPGALRAQTLAPSGATITLSPVFPQAGESFTARAEIYEYDIARAQITWRIDGVVREEYANMQTVTLTAPEVGESLELEARLTSPVGSTSVTSATVVAHTIDLVVEGDTAVPHFYRGRALPSPGSMVRFVAVPALYRADGTLIPQNDLVYKWTVDNSTVQGNRNVLTTTMPRTGSLLVSVTAQTRDGRVQYTTYQRIEPADPLLLFYEDNPLYGLGRAALPRSFTLLVDEISVRAVPYFISREVFSNAKYGWELNGQGVENPNDDPQSLTLRTTGGAGATEVSFAVRNLKALQQAAEGAFTVYFGN